MRKHTSLRTFLNTKAQLRSGFPTLGHSQPMYIGLCLTLNICISMTMASSNMSEVKEVKDMAVSNTQFAFDLLRGCGGEVPGKSLIYAPYSISTALAMTSLGAEGPTAKEIKKVLKWMPGEVPVKGFEKYLSLLKAAVSDNTPGYLLAGAQRIYVSKALSLKPEFNSMTQQYFASETSSADFTGNPDGEREGINSWVTKQTHGKIENLLPAGSINPLTAMVLVQALYFKGNWMHKFDANDTKPADFFSPQGKVTVQMMQQERKFKHFQSEELACAAVELPYASNNGSTNDHDLHMLVLLPDAIDGLEKLEKSISHDALKTIQSDLHSVKVNLKLPRFSVESSFSLKGILSIMGMPLAFSDQADFSGMVTGPISNELYISEIFHKAVVEVNEEGTVAAAATGVVMMARSMPIIMDFHADHPFLFFIIDKRADVVLFSGRVMNPLSDMSQQKQEL